jgi:hypothetical protein
MWRWLIGLFLVSHGLIHAAVHLAPTDASSPFDPADSWLLGGLGLGDGAARTLSVVLASATALGFVLVGLGLLAHQEWWRPAPVVAAAVGLVLLALYFNPWLSMGLAINAVVLASLLWARWPSEELVGA